MNTEANVMPGSSPASQVILPGPLPVARLLYWSIRRELWENRSIFIAPLVVAGVALFGFFLSSFVGIWEEPLRLIPAKHRAPFDMAAGLMMLTGIVVSVFYCLDALHGERRDRSVFFWKSMPVSDLTTVLAKASIPLFVLPLIVVTVTIAMQWLMLLFSSAVVLASGMSVGELWRHLSIIQMWSLLLCHFATAHVLWPYPVYCWLLLVSGWAKRAVFLWAALPVLVIGGFERMTFHTFHFAEIVGGHLIGNAPVMDMAEGGMGLDPLTTHVTMGRFISSPGLWIGLVLSAVFLAAAVRLRRYQGPI
jgi:ABC-2 type transport system permease protein